MVHDWNVLQAELALASGAERTNRRPPGHPLFVLRCGRPGRQRWRGRYRLVPALQPRAEGRSFGFLQLCPAIGERLPDQVHGQLEEVEQLVERSQ
jgi:hypothetical protein